LPFRHVIDQAPANDIGNLKQDIPAALPYYPAPHKPAVSGRQDLDNVRKVRRVHTPESLIQFGKILPMDDCLKQFLFG